MSEQQPSSLEALDQTWARWQVGWHSLYLGMVAACALSVGTSGADGAVILRAVDLLAAMTASYLLLAYRCLGTENSWRGIVHLLIAWASFIALIATTDFDQVYFLLFALIPQVWMYLSRNWAIVGMAAAVAALAAAEISEVGWSVAAALDTLPWAALQFTVSLLLGLFLTGAFNEAERRAGLIDELERTRSELATAEHARGILAERERLSHEIHDTLAQGFTSVLALAQAAEAALDRDPAQARDRLVLLEATARDNLAEARALVGALAPADLHDTTLAEAIRRVAGRFADETGAETTVEVAPGPALPANAEVVLVRAAQEALANVRKHAGAGRVRVGLAYPAGQDTAVLTVADDGSGFDLADPEGFGLHGMRARVAQVGGTLEIVSAPGAGTTIRVSVPGR